jgi:hypothetical protein
MPPMRTWWSRHALRLHGVLLGGLALCGVATWVEWARALNGHTIAWVYAFEWPLFAALGTAMWWRLLRTEVGAVREKPPARRSPADAIAPDDPGLAAWQDYLSRLHAADPPGGPPS